MSNPNSSFDSAMSLLIQISNLRSLVTIFAFNLLGLYPKLTGETIWNAFPVSLTSDTFFSRVHATL